MSKLATQRIGFLGAGAMGEALAGGLVAGGVPRGQIRMADPEPVRLDSVSRVLGVETSGDNAAVVRASDVVVLAVKPGLVARVLQDVVAALGDDAARPLWVSIAAGVSLAKLEGVLPRGTRAVRAMPNTPALVREGATAWCANAAASDADREIAQALFAAAGFAWAAPDESLLDAVTGLSGSGPAYVFVLLEALADAGVRVGLPRDAAQQLAVQTVLGAAALARETGLHPAQLKDRVTSPGGTTIAGLARLEAAGFRAALIDAVEAATKRSKELGQ